MGPLGTTFSEIKNTDLFIHKNEHENIVCEVAAILSMGDEFNFRAQSKNFMLCPDNDNTPIYVQWRIRGTVLFR